MREPGRHVEHVARAHGHVAAVEGQQPLALEHEAGLGDIVGVRVLAPTLLELGDALHEVAGRPLGRVDQAAELDVPALGIVPGGELGVGGVDVDGGSGHVGLRLAMGRRRSGRGRGLFPGAAAGRGQVRVGRATAHCRPDGGRGGRFSPALFHRTPSWLRFGLR